MTDPRFDPVIATAAAVFEQVTAEATGTDEVPVGSGMFTSAPYEPRDGIAAALHLLTDVVLQVVDSVIGTAQPADERATLLTLHVRAGETTSTSIWLHNMTTTPVSGVVLRLTRCTAHDGVELQDVEAAFDPPKLDLATEASAQASMTVAVAASAAAGSYVGHVLASGLPESALAVRMVVA